MLGKIRDVNLNQVQKPESVKKKRSDLQPMERLHPNKTLNDKISINKKVNNIDKLYRLSEVEKDECDSLYDLLINVLEEQGITIQTPSGNIKIDTRALGPSEAQELIFSISHLKKLKYGFPKTYLIYDKQGTLHQLK